MKKWSPSACRCLKWSGGLQLTLDGGWHPWKACLLKQMRLVHRWQGWVSIWWAWTATFPRSSWNTRCIWNWLEKQNVGDRSVEHDDAIAVTVLWRLSVSIGGSGSAASIAASSSLMGVCGWWWVGEAQPRGRRDPFSTSVHRCDRIDIGSVCDQTISSARRTVPRISSRMSMGFCFSRQQDVSCISCHICVWMNKHRHAYVRICREETLLSIWSCRGWCTRLPSITHTASPISDAPHYPPDHERWHETRESGRSLQSDRHFSCLRPMLVKLIVGAIPFSGLAIPGCQVAPGCRRTCSYGRKFRNGFGIRISQRSLCAPFAVYFYRCRRRQEATQCVGSVSSCCTGRIDLSGADWFVKWMNPKRSEYFSHVCFFWVEWSYGFTPYFDVLTSTIYLEHGHRLCYGWRLRHFKHLHCWVSHATIGIPVVGAFQMEFWTRARASANFPILSTAHFDEFVYTDRVNVVFLIFEFSKHLPAEIPIRPADQPNRPTRFANIGLWTPIHRSHCATKAHVQNEDDTKDDDDTHFIVSQLIDTWNSTTPKQPTPCTFAHRRRHQVFFFCGVMTVHSSPQGQPSDWRWLIFS